MLGRRGQRQNRRGIGSTGGGGAAPFVPTSVAGCLLWLRADMGITLNGGDVSAWADQSGAATPCDVSQGTAGNQPLFEATGYNGKESVNFTKANTDHLVATAGSMISQVAGNDTPFTICIASQLTAAAAAADTIWSFGKSSSASLYTRFGRGSASAIWENQRQDGGVVKTADGGTADTNRQIITYIFTGTLGRIFSGGAEVTTAGGEDQNTNTIATVDRFALGAFVRNTVAQPCSVRVAEVIGYSGALNDSDRGLVEAYLTARYA